MGAEERDRPMLHRLTCPPVRQSLGRWIACASLALRCIPLAASPYRPASDDEVLESVPVVGTVGAASDLQLIEQLVARDPKNVDIVTPAVATLIKVARERNDPTLYGRAEAYLAPWWRIQHPPEAVLPLRAAILQHQHAFSEALADLDSFLKLRPEDGSARLAQATVLQVVGEFGRAQAACLRLPPRVDRLVAEVCSEWARSLTEDPSAAVARLRTQLAALRPQSTAAQSFARSALGDMERRLGHNDRAIADFSEALKLNANDAFAMVSLADTYLDVELPESATRVLEGAAESEAVSVRRVIAAQMARQSIAAAADVIAAGFAAATRRNTNVHQREEALFELKIRDRPARAVQLAKENWRAQRETVDLRILIQTGIAARDSEALAIARDWLKTSRFYDVVSQRLLDSGTAQ